MFLRTAIISGFFGVAMTLNALATFFQDCFVNVANSYSGSFVLTHGTKMQKHINVNKTLGSAFYLILTALILKACDVIIHGLIPIVTITDGNADSNDDNSGNGYDDGHGSNRSNIIKDSKDVLYASDVEIVCDDKTPSIIMNPIVAEMVRPAGSFYDDN